MFIKRSFHNFQGTFSFCVSSRMAYELTRGAHAQETEDAQKERGEDKDERPSRDEEVARAGAERDERKEEASRDTGKKLAKHLDKVESKRGALEKVAAIIKESPEDIEKAFYNYNLSEHDESNRTPKLEAQRIIQKIIDAKKEHKLDGITFIYLGGTNGQRHDLNKLEKTRDAEERKEWHKKKSEAFTNILKGKNTIQPVELQTFILTNEDLIKEYQEKVADNKPNKLKIFLAANDAAFCDAAGLFDLALAYQRADDLYGVINEGKRIDPLKDIVTLDLKTGAGSEDLKNCRSKLEFTMPEGGRADLAPTPPSGEAAPEPTPPKSPKPGPNDPPQEAPLGGRADLAPGSAPLGGSANLEPEPIPPNGEAAPVPTPPKPGPNDPSPETPPAPLGGKAELVLESVPLEAKHFAHKDAESATYKDKLDKAKEVLQSLDVETKRRLTHLAPPFFNLKNSLQPKIDDGEKGNGHYYVYIDIRNTPEDIKKNLEKAAQMIIEERFLPNTPQEKDALIEAKKKGLPFKNIRQAYVDDMKRSPKIDWNKSNVSPIAPNEWTEKEQEPWLNYDVETPAEKNERARAIQEKEEDKRETARKEKVRAAEENKKKETERAEEIKNKEADPDDLDSLKKILEAFNAKRNAFNATNGMKLVSRFDTFNTSKGPYSEADIDEYKEAVGNLSSGIDRFGGIFESMSINTKNILKSVELMIDQEDSERGKSEKNISRNADGSYRLWFDISKDKKTVKKDLIDQKNKFVKGKKYTEDSPIEAAQSVKAGATFKNPRQAYQEKGSDGKRFITYDAKKDEWVPSKGREWLGKELYDYSTVEIAAPVETREKDETPKQKQHTIEVRGPGGHQWIVFTRKDGAKKEYQILAYGAGIPYPKVAIPSGSDKNSDYVNIQMGDVSLDVDFRNPPKGDLYAQNQHGGFFSKYHVEVSGNIIKILSQVSKAPAPKTESASESPYVAASTDTIKLVGNTIRTKQEIDKKSELDTYTLDNKIDVLVDPQRIIILGKNVMALKISTKDNELIGYIYLDETRTMRISMQSGYRISISGKIITVSKKREL